MYLDEALGLVYQLKPENPKLKKRVRLSRGEWYLQQFKQSELYEYSPTIKSYYQTRAFENFQYALNAEEILSGNEMLLNIKVLNSMLDYYLTAFMLASQDPQAEDYLLAEDYLKSAEYLSDFIYEIIVDERTKQQIQPFHCPYQKSNVQQNSICQHYRLMTGLSNPLKELTKPLSILRNYCAIKQKNKFPNTYDAAYVLLNSSHLIRQLALKIQQTKSAQINQNQKPNCNKQELLFRAHGIVIKVLNDINAKKKLNIHKDPISINYQLESYAYGYLANIHLANQEYSEQLLNYYQYAIELIDDGFCRVNASFAGAVSSELAAQWHRQKGKVHKMRGELNEAIQEYEKAINLIECVRQDIERCSYGSSCSFEKVVHPLYMELIDLFMQRGINVDDKFCDNSYVKLDNGRNWEADLNKKNPQCHQAYKFEKKCDLYNALDALANLNKAELASYFLDPCIGLRKTPDNQSPPPNMPLQQPLRNLLSKESTIIYPLIYPDKLIILVQDNKGVKQLELMTNIKQIQTLQKTAKRFSETIRNRSFPYSKDGSWLYQHLIAPLKAYIESTITTLVIVPDEHLRMLPWAALYDGAQNKYLVEQYALAITPNTKIPLTIDYQDSENQRLLLAGLSDINLDEFIEETNRSEEAIYDNEYRISYDGELYSKLPFVKEELLCVDKQVNEARNDSLLLAKNFTYQTLQNRLADNEYRILHIASHALFRNDIKESVIITGGLNRNSNQENQATRQEVDGIIHENQDIHMNQLEQLIHASRKYDKLSYIGKNYPKRPTIEMLVLSACSTAADEEKSALGLSGIAVKAGVPSVVGTLWEIDDMSTSVLMAKFYSALNLQNGKSELSRAKALQAAQIHMLKGQFIPRRDEDAQTACDKINRNYLFSRNATPVNIMVHPYYWSPFVVIGDWRAFGSNTSVH